LNRQSGKWIRILGGSLLCLSMLVTSTAVAQHEHHGQPTLEPPVVVLAPPSILQLEILRNGSGTAWEPETLPHAALHHTAGRWDLMFHMVLFGGYDIQSSDRGDDALVGSGWFMAMARRRFENATLTGRLMLSPEPWTVRDGGYPLLLQTGETYENLPLHDRQHPHDLFMEIGAVYTQAIGDSVALQLYAAASGEPALGPTAFPHRMSAMSDPLAALGHHWQDSTHISFGVLTAGLVTRFFKLEGSWFNGREPDERRYDFDLHRPDSFSVRLSVAPMPSLTGQVSYGYLPNPELLLADHGVHRATTSVAHSVPFRTAGHWATTAVLGLNKEGHDSPSFAALAETNLSIDGFNVVFGRVEAVQKSGHDLVLAPALDESRFLLSALSLGYLRNFGPLGAWLPGLGIRGAVNLLPRSLEGVYGTRLPIGGMFFLRLGLAPLGHGGH
jgi:hypothetical protein